MKRNKKTCPICNKEISCSNYSKHIESCKHKKPKIKVLEEWKLSNGNYKCPYCDKEYKLKGISGHIWRYHSLEGENFNPNIGYKNGTRKGKTWNKGLNSNIDSRVLKYTTTLRNRIPKIGSYGGRSKKGIYKGYYCDSSWELAFVIYNLEHNISFKRNKEGFKYIFDGIERMYYPDFIILNDIYVEIKGYETERDRTKLKQFPYDIQLLKYDEMKPILEYVISKYGKDFISLYE